jgi:hypothetical protein
MDNDPIIYFLISIFLSLLCRTFFGFFIDTLMRGLMDSKEIGKNT